MFQLYYSSHSQPPIRIRPIASLVQRGVRSPLETYCTEAVQQPRKRAKCRKLFWPSFSVIGMSSYDNFMLCTALVLLSASVHNTTPAFLLIPALTCSYLPCIYSGHMLLVGLLRGFNRTYRTYRTLPPPATDLHISTKVHTTVEHCIKL